MRTAFACLTLALVACTDLTEVPYGEVTEKNVKPSIGSLIAPAYTPQLRDQARLRGVGHRHNAGLIAELRALRADNYSLLLDNFGNVPKIGRAACRERRENLGGA